jgi:beta-galactosidase
VARWRAATEGWMPGEIKVNQASPSTLTIVVTSVLPDIGATTTMTYTIHSSGDVIVETSYQPGSRRAPMLPRFGTELIVAPGLENLTWYGRGPRETYMDRQFERVGVYRSTVDDEWVDYSQPQENGNKTDVRWIALTNKEGIGLLAVGAPTLSVAARHYSKADIERARYTWQMARRDQTYLNLDWKQMGVGGIDSWSPNAWPLPAYRLEASQPMTFKYRLTPIQGDFTAKTREAF